MTQYCKTLVQYQKLISRRSKRPEETLHLMRVYPTHWNPVTVSKKDSNQKLYLNLDGKSPIILLTYQLVVKLQSVEPWVHIFQLKGAPSWDLVLQWLSLCTPNAELDPRFDLWSGN